jgi:hypothetical protein
MIEVGYQEQGIVFAFNELHLPVPVCTQGRQHNRADENDDETRQGKEFIQPEWFWFFIACL